MLAVPTLSVGNLRAFLAVWQPDVLANGHEPEQRIVFSGVSWRGYLETDEALGHDRSGPRLYYLDGELEVMSTSKEHERIKTKIAECLTIYFDAIGIDVDATGQATMRSELQAAAEPDESWCLHEEKALPDFVLEIALTSGGVRKLELYQRFGVPEVWFWRRGGLEIHAFLADKTGYERVPRSRLLPGLDLALLERCVGIRSWREARLAFRAGLAAVE